MIIIIISLNNNNFNTKYKNKIINTNYIKKKY